MATYDRSMRPSGPEAMTKAEFCEMIGITPELEKFLDEFIQQPEMLNSLPLERQHQMEAQIDAVLALFA
jgi:hypothetical protein